METDIHRKSDLEASGFGILLMRWHRLLNHREMPWKGEKDPYRVWLSEIILQQTRVEQGWGYYERFLSAYPDLPSLAAAPDRDVFKLWEGLGYYSRCRNLLETARRVVADLGGSFPSTYEGILSLKGVGPYTASAIASFAFGLPYAVVDGNVLRVLARVFGVDGPIGTSASRRLFEGMAASLLDREDPGGYNQAIMDFGAVVCKPVSPACGSCVMRDICVAYRTGRVGELPVRRERPSRRRRWMYYAEVLSDGCVLVREREGGDIWRNLHELYLIESSARIGKAALLNHPSLLKLTGEGVPDIKGLGPEYVHLLTHQELRGRFLCMDIGRGKPPVDGYRWVSGEELSKLAFPKPIAEYLGKNS